MKDSTREISPLRHRMIEDMRLRKLAPHTQASYVRAVRKLAGYLRRAPDTATVEELRNFQPLIGRSLTGGHAGQDRGAMLVTAISRLIKTSALVR